MPADKKKSASKKIEAKDQRKARDRKQSEKTEEHISAIEECPPAAETSDNAEPATGSWKREIKSNWSKYEVECGANNETDENNLEEIVYTSQSSGGYFKFKHEKSWDEEAKTSIYDKYFEIDMKALSRDICSVPFYERNEISIDCFTQSDIKTMKSRAKTFKDMKKVSEPNEKNLNNLIEILQSTTITEKNDENPTEDLSELDIIENVKDLEINIKQPIQLDLNLSPVKENQDSNKPAEEDLEQWLDDFLDS